MKRLNLKFDEKEVRRIVEKNIPVNKKTIYRVFLKKFFWDIGLLVIGVTAFAISLNFPDFISFGIAIIFMALAVLIRTMIYFIKERRKLKNSMRDIHLFIDRYNNIEKVYYTYSGSDITYFENDRAIRNYTIRGVKRLYEDIESIYLDFGDPKINIWIPRKMVDSEELADFEKVIKANYKP